MIVKKHCIAMILAGGQGSRLYALTQGVAKPAVPFGAKYRIIDFPLSNCVNSGIDTVGVLTQYQPLELNEYIGNGQPWDLDRVHGGVFILPPYQKNSGSDWYTGTANAIYQNLSFINRYDPEYVLILSGDHIYKMDYSKMLAHHIEKDADCTIAVLKVPLEETSRFGIMNTREDDSIYEFEEKPEHPKSQLASMGVYLFRTEILRRYLEEDAQNIGSENDFGANIIPAMLRDNACLQAYSFGGYWKDVGTISSLWEANMDLLDPSLPLDLGSSDWRIYARNAVRPPQYISETAKVRNSIITEGVEVYGEVNNSVLFAGVIVGENALISNSILMPGTVVEAGAVVESSIVAENCIIRAGAHVGEASAGAPISSEITVIAANVEIGIKATVPGKSMIDDDVQGVTGV